MALSAIHLWDYAFLQPQPGTSAGDHLVSGLLPVALLALSAAAYPRLGAGARASMSVILGVTVLACGIAVPIRHTVIAGPSGTDFTGILATVGGLGLIGLGATTLWHSRQADQSLGRRCTRSLLSAASGAVVIWLLYPAALAFVMSHNARVAVPAANLGTPYRTVVFTSSDGLRLVGWYVASGNGASVIVAPGRSASVQAHARMLIRHGYGVLLFDRRGEGKSQGEPSPFGWSSDKDLLGAVAFLKRQPDVHGGRIAGLGLSVGGETLLQTAAETTALRAVVADGVGARSIKEALEFPDTATKWLQLVPWFAVATPVSAMFADQTPPPNLTSLIPRISPRAVFLIWAGHGAGEDINPSYYQLAGTPKQIWKIAEAGHTGGLSARPDEYERRVVAFLDRSLSVTRSRPWP